MVLSIDSRSTQVGGRPTQLRRNSTLEIFTVNAGTATISRRSSVIRIFYFVEQQQMQWKVDADEKNAAVSLPPRSWLRRNRVHTNRVSWDLVFGNNILLFDNTHSTNRRTFLPGLAAPLPTTTTRNPSHPDTQEFLKVRDWIHFFRT